MPRDSEPRCDLHTHTKASDGFLAAPELLAEARGAGLAAVAITDHDTVSGLSAALAAAADAGVEVVPGVELSCALGRAEVHILGYYPGDPDAIEAACAAVREHRHVRMREMVEKAMGLGLGVSYEEVAALAEGESVGRPHLARLLVDKGIVPSMQTAFDRYLSDGGAAYVPKKRLTAAEGIGLIRDAGGVPVLAHPGVNGVDKHLEAILDLGIRGIEATYSMHTEGQRARFLAFAQRHDLVVTGGSDYHGDPSHGRTLGEPSVPMERLDALKAAAGVA